MKKIIGIMLAITLVLSAPLASFSDSIAFSDVRKDDAFYDAVTELSSISELGYGDKTFRPDELITRAEFVTLLLKIFGTADISEAKLDQIFIDVPVSNWANKYITIAFDKNLVNGVGGGKFSPDSNIKYEEVIKIVVSHVLGSVHRMSYPDGFIDTAKKIGLAEVHSEVGQDLKRWQVAMLIHSALNADEEIVKEIKAELPAEPERELYAAPGGSGGSGGGAAYSPAAPTMKAEATGDFYTDSIGSTSYDYDIEISEPVPLPSPYPERQISAGLLTAGVWNDNDNWDFWNKLMANREWHSLQSRWEISTNRYVVSVTDGGAPVMGAKVILSQQDNELWTAVTDNKGNAVIFANTASNEQSNEFTLRVETSLDTKIVDNVMLSDSTPYEIEIQTGDIEDSIDVMFMIDTTGSMGDELQYIKEELSDVISRITADVRISCNFYRDIGDEYIVRPFDFTTDVDEAVTQISGQRATGGGDFPEAVEIALINAIDEHDWNPNAKEHFLFLVLDAPPHHDAGRVLEINSCIKKAAAKGIRIIPVASSGIDKETEFLLRSMSITTNGTYVFLTDHSGIGNSHIEPTIGSYDVEFLNDLLVKIINERL